LGNDDVGREPGACVAFAVCAVAEDYLNFVRMGWVLRFGMSAVEEEGLM
jgi:hypothetical protein